MPLTPLAITGSLSDLLSLALTILAVSTLAGYGLLRGRVAGLREELKDERDARGSLQERFDRQAVELTDFKGKVRVLEGIVTGEVHWVALGHQLDEHHREAREFWTRAEAHTQAQENLLIEIRDDLRRNR